VIDTQDVFACRAPVEIRAGGRVIGGYAAVFDRHSHDLGGWYERVSRPFFNESRIAGWPGVVCRYNHSDEYLLGATRHGTLRLLVDDTGLSYSVNLPPDRDDILDRVRRGEIRHSSFTFINPRDDWELTDRGAVLRTLLTSTLIDVAPVWPSPAYRDTTVETRSLPANVESRVSTTCLGGCMSLSEHTGLNLLVIAKLAEEYRLRELFDTLTRRLCYANGRRISMAEQRSLARERGLERLPGKLAHQIAQAQRLRWPTMTYK
jgi:HK97 family phage prohead protease